MKITKETNMWINMVHETSLMCSAWAFAVMMSKDLWPELKEEMSNVLRKTVGNLQVHITLSDKMAVVQYSFLNKQTAVDARRIIAEGFENPILAEQAKFYSKLAKDKK